MCEQVFVGGVFVCELCFATEQVFVGGGGEQVFVSCVLLLVCLLLFANICSYVKCHTESLSYDLTM